MNIGDSSSSDEDFMDQNWKRVGIFPEEYLDEYAEFDGVQFHQKTITAKLIGMDEKCEYRCPNAGCPHTLMAERPAGSEDYQVKEKGKHNCQGNQQPNVAAEPQEQAPFVQKRQAKHPEQRLPQWRVNSRRYQARKKAEQEKQAPLVRQPSKRGRKPKQKPQEEEEVENGDPQVEIGQPDQQPNMQIGLVENDGQKQQNEDEELPAVAVLTARDRCEHLQEMAAQLGLKFRGFVDDERYYITFDKENDQVAGYNKSTMIEIAIRSINNSLIANLRTTNGVRGTANANLFWRIPEFAHFLWAVRGLCHETFVPLKERMYSKQNDSVLLPEVEEPSEEGTSNGGGGDANGQPKTFSIMDLHQELRLAELADDLGLRLQRKEEIKQLTFKYSNQLLHPTKIRLQLTESDTKIYLVELDNGKHRSDEEWQKSLGRVHFRYALMGVAVDLFGIGGK